MKPFILSRRFWVPFLSILILYGGFLVFQFWEIYKDDFDGKNLSFAVKGEWLVLTAGLIFTTCFLLCILVGTVFYVHQCAKKNQNQFSFFTRINLFCVVGVALLGFLFISFAEPTIKFRSTSLLGDIMYAKKGEAHFERSLIGFKNERMLNLAELFAVKDSFRLSFISIQEFICRNIKMNIRQTELNKVLNDLHGIGADIQSTDIIKADVPFGTQDSWECCTRNIAYRDILALEREKQGVRKYTIQIMKKMVFPIMIVLFFCIGFLLGLSFCKTYVLYPLLIGTAVFFPAWYLVQKMFDSLFLQDKIGAFSSNFGVVFILAAICTAWFFFLKKRRFLH